MAEVVRLADHRPDPSAEVIELLQTLLEQAQAGDIIGIAIAYSTADQSTATAFQYGSWLQAVGASALLHHDVLHSGEVVSPSE